MYISKKVSIFLLLSLGILTGCYDRFYPPIVKNCMNEKIYCKNYFANDRIIEGNLINGVYAHIGIGNNPEQELIKLEIYKNKKLLYIVDKKSIEEVMTKDKKIIYYEKDSFNFSGCYQSKKIR